MVRGSKRRTQISQKSGTLESPTQTTIENAKATGDSSRRVRGVSPHAFGRQSSVLRKRRSKRNNFIEGGNNQGINYDYIPSMSHHAQAVPSNWTTASGKFDPTRSEVQLGGFDARSNMAINVVLNHGSSDSVNTKMSVDDSECSPSNTSNDSKKYKTGNKHKSKKNTGAESCAAIIEGEFEDPVERHRFYKNLKKVGIKKTLTVDEDWENCSSRTEFSELSVSNASYILDLAQQKETRKKDREEEALEEGLELYGTWLTEGKNDDKNIFLMILHEVKKEQKAKYAKSDKNHDSLLDAALNDELIRREKVKQEEEEEDAKAAAQLKELKLMRVPDTRISAGSSSSYIDRSSHTRRSSHCKKSQSKISEIISQNASQRNMNMNMNTNTNINENENENENNSYHKKNRKENESKDCPEEWTEGPYERDSITYADSPKPSIRKSGLFSCFGSSARHMQDDVLNPMATKSADSFNSGSFPGHKEDSKRMFSRLRTELSEKQAEQWKEAEKSWRKNGHVETQEEKWFKKINDAKKENILFDQSIAVLDLTTKSEPKNTMRTVSSSIAEIEKKTKEESTSLKKKKNSKATSDSDFLHSPKGMNSEKKKKKKKEKKANEVGDTSSLASEFSELKSTDKKKKKKVKVVEGEQRSMDLNDNKEKNNTTEKVESIMTKKKKEKTFKDGSKNGRVIGVVDNSDTKSSKSARKKKSKDTSGKNSVDEEWPARKKKSKSDDTADKDTASLKLLKKKKKKRGIDPESDDCVHSDYDWSDRCILETDSDETRGCNTVITMESS